MVLFKFVSFGLNYLTVAANLCVDPYFKISNPLLVFPIYKQHV